MTATRIGNAAPGWFPDPYAAGQWRWWDGYQWTQYAWPAAPAVVVRPSNGYGAKITLAVCLILGLGVLLFVIGSATGALAPTGSAEGWRPDAAGAVAPNPAVDAALASTVEVDAYVSDDWYATGAAVAISETRFLTAQHVVEGARTVLVIDADGNELTAVVVRQDAQRDLAVLETEPHGVPIATIAATEPSRGDKAYAVGGSNWFKPITAGVVTGVRDKCGDGVEDVTTTAKINPGDSGGPLVDDLGQVVGISTSRFDNGEGSATSSAEIRDFLALADNSFDSDGYLVRPSDRDDGYCHYVD